ncbi:hypothetical protein IQ07DRAFT_136867 [Pyrenochaeta sp. DS3sAY3a]|nr:hypothetical protein IQ07DRAFT_136867 [Pyrenochaeta sp. DS3sAY3a]
MGWNGVPIEKGMPRERAPGVMGTERMGRFRGGAAHFWALARVLRRAERVSVRGRAGRIVNVNVDVDVDDEIDVLRDEVQGRSRNECNIDQATMKRSSSSSENESQRAMPTRPKTTTKTRPKSTIRTNDKRQASRQAARNKEISKSALALHMHTSLPCTGRHRLTHPSLGCACAIAGCSVPMRLIYLGR